MGALLRWLDPIMNPLACLPLAPETPPTQNADNLLRRLDTLLRQKLKYAPSGEQKSWLKGQGLDFADLREYTPGDDIRKMDWSVFARTLTPHVREYHEEKQLTLWLVIDLTPSMRFGQTGTKTEKAIELAGLFCLLAERAGHKLGAYLINGAQPEIIPPNANPAHYRHLIQRAIQRALVEPGHQPYDPVEASCQQLCHLVKKQSTIIFLSDFICASRSWETTLGQLSHKARILSLLLSDPVETALPSGVGFLTFQDPETGLRVLFDTHSAAQHDAYQKKAHAAQAQTLIALQSFGAAALAPTQRDSLDILLDLLKAGSLFA